MKKISEYRRHANECRTLATSMSSHEQRDQLLAMAQTWDRLADERIRSVRLSEWAMFSDERPQGER